ncbi:putative DNA-binding protein (UPF0251 family) [Sporomusaceae bacterium BoRhaA]|uniref:DUF134 domain-containing protein n=1 Tax=Pelorhabdus rhamnosifermentans TaxID=2772457 RepID=UPI001C060EDB|nr:DUF134 domain-containing protein [Pelorhabdus rhamnosifermentans]MBU2701339.1 putative DNA-binding protein (UPF0251 family) [Pelorhabdus rhamnosifermentans]
MPRRRCCGLVEQEPCHRQLTPLDDEERVVTLLVEELETIRLKNLTGMDQAACAVTMGVSRATFQRILNAARQKIT